MTTQEPEYTVCWTGATWRSFQQPQTATGFSQPHLMDEIRAYLSARPGRWLVAKEIRQVLDCSTDDLNYRLKALTESGDVEADLLEKWGKKRWCYRWVQKSTPPKSVRRVRPTAVQYQAMKARLSGEV